jgi:restriction endonuclease Mrr
MTFTEAAAHVLRLIGKPLHYKEITDVAIEQNLLSHVGKSPEVTMGARLAALVKKGDKDNPLIRVKPGVFALREWSSEVIARGLADRTPALERLAAAMLEAGETLVDVADDEEANPVETASAGPAARNAEEPRDTLPPITNEDDRRRAELAAGATELFVPEPDDDQPIFGSGNDEEWEEDEADDTDRNGGSRRRRRRRRRSRTGDESRASSDDDLPTYTVSEPSNELLKAVDAELRARESREADKSAQQPNRTNEQRAEARVAPAPVQPPPQPQGERARTGAVLDDLAGRDLADAILQILSGYDRNAGPVGLQRLVETGKRRGRISADLAQGQALVESSLRADNARRIAAGQRPRFRISDRRVSPSDWLLDNEMLRLERELQQSADRFREHTRKTVLRRLQELPQRSVGELILVLLERVGYSDFQPIKRPGTHGAELHLSARLALPHGEYRAALVIRRDGREIGRERVTELRGALHHYGPAQIGSIITTGQALSGAREEAAAPNATPVNLIDGLALVRMCEQEGIGVVRSSISLSVPDVELFDALRSGG